jgi:hypothetical protein
VIHFRFASELRQARSETFSSSRCRRCKFAAKVSLICDEAHRRRFVRRLLCFEIYFYNEAEWFVKLELRSVRCWSRDARSHEDVVFTFTGRRSMVIMAFVARQAALISLGNRMLTAMFTVHLQYGYSSITLKAVTAYEAQFGPVGL